MIKSNIYKAAGLIIRNRKVLVSRNRDKDIFVQPGGKLEAGETPVEALIRELYEEQNATVRAKDLTDIGTFHGIAAGHEAEGLTIELYAFLVDYVGPVEPNAEVQENLWVNSDDIGTIKMGSILEHDIIPLLVTKNLID